MDALQSSSADALLPLPVVASAATPLLLSATPTVGLTTPTVNMATPTVNMATPSSLCLAAAAALSNNNNSTSISTSTSTSVSHSCLSSSSSTSNSVSGGATAAGMCDEKTVEYLRDLIAEKQAIETQFGAESKNVVIKLLDQGESVKL